MSSSSSSSSSSKDAPPQPPERGQVYQAVVHGTVVQLELIAASSSSRSEIRESHSQQHPPLLSLHLENFSGTLRLVLPSTTTTEAGDGWPPPVDEELGVIPEIPSVGLTESSDEAEEVRLQQSTVDRMEDESDDAIRDYSDDAIQDDTRLTIGTPTTPSRKPLQLVGALSSLNSGDTSSTRKKHHMPATVQAVRTARHLGHLMDRSGHSSDTDGHSTHPNVSAVSGLSSSSLLAGRTLSGDILLHTPPPTELHRICTAEVVTASELEHVRITRKDAAMPDALGLLPLHILGDNDKLIASDQRDAITKLGLRLMQIYPEAITTLDSEGRMPFVRLIEDWVAWVQDVAVKSPKKRGMMTAGIFDRVISQQPSSGNRGKDQPNGEAAGNGVGEESEATRGRATQQSQHADQPLLTVELWEEVEWSLVMLSTALEILRAGASSARLLRGNDEANTAEQSTQLREKAEEACKKLAKHCVAVAPNLLKCLLILETETRERIFAMQIIKRILFCPESVGTWLTTLLRKGSSSSRCGVMYLATVSKLTAKDRFGGQHELSSADFSISYEEREQVFDAIGSLDGMVGSLVVLEEIELEKVLRTTVIWRIISQKLSRPFVVSLVLIDFILHLTLMLVCMN